MLVGCELGVNQLTGELATKKVIVNSYCYYLRALKPKLLNTWIHASTQAGSDIYILLLIT